jgi:hypothetical protein
MAHGKILAAGMPAASFPLQRRSFFSQSTKHIIQEIKYLNPAS